MEGTSSMSRIVLIPGMGCGSWIWQPVARRLVERGRAALPLTLPGLGFADDRAGHRLDDAVDFVVEAINVWAQHEPVTLVGHSWGGFPVTGAAMRLGPERIREVVYVNAVVPARGVAMRDENPEMAAVIDAQLRSAGHISASPDDVAARMMQDESPVAQRIVAELLVPTPAGYFTDALQTDAVSASGIAARYILGAADLGLARPGQEFAARLGVEPEMIDGSHMSIFTNPEPIVQKLTAGA
jgi:pimeloyl-ACP methyl ester carboxylesterase